MTESIRTDKKLADACAAGDRTAQRELYERYRNALYNSCLRYATDPAEAEDFLHDGLLKVFANINRYRADGPLGAWVRRVVINEALQHLRRRPAITELTRSLEETGKEDEIDEAASAIPPATLQRYIRELPLGYRTVFSLYYLEEYTHDQIADHLGITSGASKSQLSKAKRKLRSVILSNHPQLQLR